MNTNRGVRPNLFIVGGPKTGTTALSTYLGSHRNVWISNPKEPFFWCTDFPESKSIHGIESDQHYFNLFADAKPEQHRIVGEASTTYLQSRMAIEGILSFNRQAKFIAMLRNPIEVAYAMHGELLRHGFENEPNFEVAWHRQRERSEGKSIPKNCPFPHQLQYRDVASFGQQIHRFFGQVETCQREVIIFDDFVTNTPKVYQKLLRFLELDDDGREHFPRLHEAKVNRLSFLTQFYEQPPTVLAPTLRRVRKWYHGHPGMLQSILRKLVFRSQPREPLRETFRAEIAKEFRDDVCQLSELLQRDLSGWLDPSKLTEASSQLSE